MQAVVFDLDGTLIDSLPDIAGAVNHVLALRGLASLRSAQIAAMIGDGAKILINRAFLARNSAAGEADLAAFMAYYFSHVADQTRPYPGIEQVLVSLRQSGFSLGVCTNKPAAAAREILAQLRLDFYFNAVTGGDSTPYRKPDSRHLAATLAALGAREAVMIGDHHNDIEAAAGLGIPAIFAAWGYGQADAPYTAQSAAELPALIARVLSPKG